MSVLKIYCDESGTMPINEDKKDIFLATAIGTINNFPDSITFSGHKSWIIQKMKEFKITPAIAYINPEKGYGKLYQTKI